MEKILIVDGMNLLFQMFYGMPSRISGPDGRPIQGTLGFVGALLRILRQIKPNYVAVLFDGACHNPRKDLDDAYKANRPDYSLLPEEETPFCQLPDVYAALDLLGLAHAETMDCEADDWMAGYARCYGKDREVVIASFDSDLFQLIDDHVRIYRYRGARSCLCDRAYIQEKFGIQPEQYAAFKALVGDTADNIRGVPKVGPKTAAALLMQFGDLENLLDNLQQVTRPAIRSSLQENVPRIRINQLLVTLPGAGKLPFSLEAMSYRETGFTTMQVLAVLGLR